MDICCYFDATVRISNVIQNTNDARKKIAREIKHLFFIVFLNPLLKD